MANIRVRRANVILDVSSDAKEKYLANGYSVIDESGDVVEAALPTDIQGLKTLVAQLQAELAKKDAEIAELKKSKTSTRKKAE